MLENRRVKRGSQCRQMSLWLLRWRQRIVFDGNSGLEFSTVGKLSHPCGSILSKNPNLAHGSLLILKSDEKYAALQVLNHSLLALQCRITRFYARSFSVFDGNIHQ